MQQTAKIKVLHKACSSYSSFLCSMVCCHNWRAGAVVLRLLLKSHCIFWWIGRRKKKFLPSKAAREELFFQEEMPVNYCSFFQFAQNSAKVW